MSEVIFKGELQLLRWSETSNGGATVTFQLADPAELEHFKDMTLAKKGQAGQRIAAMMAEVGDDEQPVQQPGKPKGGELARQAGIWCADPRFQQWFLVSGEIEAKAKVCDLCWIKSRSELDHDKNAADRFNNLISAPYRKHVNT